MRSRVVHHETASNPSLALSYTLVEVFCCAELSRVSIVCEEAHCLGRHARLTGTLRWLLT
eukprot:jgi/Botrbrau1/17288/Bobra.0015s0045.1